MEVTGEEKLKLEKIGKKYDLRFIVLHGSYAKGTPRPGSDLDIAIVGKDRIGLDEFLDIHGELSDIFGDNPERELDLKTLQGADPLRAIFQAIEEAMSIRHWTIHARRYYGDLSPDASRVASSPELIDNQRVRVFFSAEPANFRHLEFFFQGEYQPLESFLSRFPTISGPDRKLSHLVQILRAKGPDYEPYYYQANHPILGDLGYYSVRVIVPALIHMYMRERNIPLGSRRLREAPPLLGHRPAMEPNAWPHPFP